MTRVYFNILQNRNSQKFYIRWQAKTVYHREVDIGKPSFYGLHDILIELGFQDIVSKLQLCELIDEALDTHSIVNFIEFDSVEEAIIFKMKHTS